MRFPEFTGEWKVKPLGNECTINPKVPSLENEFVYVDLESVVKGILTNTNHLNKSEAPSRAQRVLSDKDILFQCVRPYQLNNYIYHRQDNKQWVASTGYAQIRTKHNIYFLYQLLNTPQFNQEVILRCTGTSYPAISSTDLGNIPISICSNEEQKKIGELLYLVDERILAQSKIIEGLKELKASLSRQIFSRKLRFKDENGNDFPEWEEKKLGEVAKITTGSSNRVDSILNGEYTFFDRSQDIRTSNIYLFDGEAVIVPGEGQEFIPKYFIGKFDLHQRTYAIMNFDHCCGKFIYYYISYNTRHLDSCAVGSTVKSLRLPMFENMPISCPSFLEQQKIAFALSAIDEKIEIEKKVRKQFIEQKKHLLKQMFI